jgi:hypothetical protein
MEIVKFYIISLTLMNRHSGTIHNNKKDRTKARAATPMVGAIVTAALLLSGVPLFSSYHQPVLAQDQNMTEGGGGAAAGNMTGAAAGNQSEIRMRLEEARTALQGNDTQGAMTAIEAALSALGGAIAGNMTGAAAGNMTGAAAGNMTGEAGEAATNMTTGGGEGGGGGGLLEGLFGGGGGQ